MRGRAELLALLAGGLALTLTACGGDSGGDDAKPAPKVSGGYVPQPVGHDMAAGFFVVTNKGGADRLTSVTSPLAEEVTLHSTENGQMREQDSFAVPAHGRLDFARGGNHLMFEGLRHTPKRGETVTVTLHFATSGAVKAVLPVKETTYQPPSAGETQDKQ
ncbi:MULTISPECIES: copper chaperone PCu(A)C [unclassified Streptomyces]|uniref:copper chaperone PCu(A)C n=1 Tax=unclassified Streptomyces TaxID=2593676 RepID=UPI0005669041